MDDEQKQDGQPPFDGRHYRQPPLYTTAADLVNMKAPETSPTPGLTQSPGLREVPNSQVPAMADGTMVSHVMGPGQAPVDPIAAGLDTGHNPQTRAENRVVTQTGVIAAGPRPSTYVEKGALVAQAAPADGAHVQAPADVEAEASPGPNSVAAPTPAPAPAAPDLQAPVQERAIPEG